jgi:hypothetical protein
MSKPRVQTGTEPFTSGSDLNGGGP